ncbi:MAG: reverse transcriptase-like protein [Methylococcaceae bacterium]
MKKVIINFDGGIRPHPEGGFACCYGWVIQLGATRVEGHDLEVLPVNAGSSYAEYGSLLRALCAAIDFVPVDDLQNTEFLVIGDSKAAIDICMGEAKTQSSIINRHMMDVVMLAGVIGNVNFKWVPREQNTLADALCKKAFDVFTRQDERVVLMDQIYVGARRIFGHRFSHQFLSDWVASMIGKPKLAKASLGELLMLQNSLRKLA